MDVLGDLVARDRRSSQPAFVDRGTGNSISYHDFCTTAYKSGNVLRYLGVREGVTVAVVGSVGPQPLWAVYGAAQLGAVTAFVDSAEAGAALDPRVLLVPMAEETEVEPAPGTKLAVYGDAPTQPTTLHWEKELWSENPAVHPAEVASSDQALVGAGRTYSHEDLLTAAAAVVERFELDADSRVVVRGPLSAPSVVTAGLVAPILAGGTVVRPRAADHTTASTAALDDQDADGVGDDTDNDIAVVVDDQPVPEPVVCRPRDVPLD